jgi:hypothetical protein
MEVIRLREELIERVNESNILAKIYLKQAEVAQKKGVQINHETPIAFTTSGQMQDYANLVDMNDGKSKSFKLPFMEFDEELRANLDLKSQTCIQALMTDLGVEEMRAILHYQIMQQKLLTVAVMNNQALIDGPQKGIVELQLLAKTISVPNSTIDLTDGSSLFSQKIDGPVEVSIKEQ